MNKKMDRLPALPLIANDPYFSVWMPGDTLTSACPVHWSGAPKHLDGYVLIDGKEYCYFGKSSKPELKTVSLQVTPTRTVSVMEGGGVELTAVFWSPALPDDLDVLSTPITFVDYAVRSLDGNAHSVRLGFFAGAALCYDGQAVPGLLGDQWQNDGLNTAFIGRTEQRVLGHSGDHITMDWGYLYMASAGQVTYGRDGLRFSADMTAGTVPAGGFLMLGYDDIASINYFGSCCKAWGLRNGKTLPRALSEFSRRHDELLCACRTLDEQVLEKARSIGGEDYALIAAAAWRHTFAAHKLIAAPDGKMAFLSKENDSNGCIGTVDVSYPSIPLFLAFCPELVNALCRPVLYFASLPVWQEDFAPHDVGRYPYATGQVYAAKRRLPNGQVPPPLLPVSGKDRRL